MMAATTKDVRQALKSLIPLGWLGRAGEVVAAAFLASDECGFTTGAELSADDGATV